MEEHFFEGGLDQLFKWCSDIGIQGAAAFASLALSIYNLKKSKRCNCDHNIKDLEYYSPNSSERFKLNDHNSVKSSTNRVRLPKRKKIVKSTEDFSFIDEVKLVLEESVTLISREIRRIISRSIEENQFTNEQWISALSYEFVGVYGSENIQQADVEVLCTVFSETINPRYKGYVEFLILLKNMEKVIFKAFEPKVALMSLFLLTSDPTDEFNRKSLMRAIKMEDLEMSKLMSSVTAISISRRSMELSEEDVYEAVDAIKAAIVRRSSRIRKINK